ncbi:F-box/FBD/LRR-repeat protein At3g14710-like [Chenopodium quinoa]|uniref:F-box/FBD/LRR-repeat protein At3g14710-like n=1 Tax=Chenopodium quinoa TaxID=63459 RepID=UPI000B798231|nr:F-box/FBD/LRR-repeat protein At3g14710-like [Chenopodium quinoa]
MNSDTINDRLSSLPDSVLITILSLLPTNSAAATSVLSHSWRRLWTHITHFSFEPWKDWRYDYNFRDSMNTVNHILFQLTSSKLHTFHLNIPNPHSYTLFPDLETDTVLRDGLACLVPLINLVCQRNPEVITVFFQNSYPIQLHHLPPVQVVQTKSLVTLELYANIELKFPDNLAVNLPNLKRLHMYLYDSQRHNLYIDMDKSSSLILNSKFVIDAPKLEQFTVVGILAINDFVTIPSNLEQVTLDLQKMDDNEVFLNERLVLFRGISCVRTLTIMGNCGVTLLDFLNKVDLPIYINLVHLIFDCVEQFHINGRPQLPSSWLAKLKEIEVSIKMFNFLGSR